MKTDPNARRDIDLSGGVYDIETQDWDTFVCGGHLTPSGDFRAFTWRQEADYITYLFKQEGDLWAHNGGRFDHKYTIDHAIARKLPVNVALSGSSVVVARIGERLVLKDSYALFKIPLAELTQSQGVSKQKLPPCFRCHCDNDCGGYCDIRRDMPAVHMRQLIAYMEADHRSLLEALNKFREFAANNDLDLGATVGGSAWRNARRLLGLESSRLSSSEHLTVREAYFGGRVQVFRPAASRGHEYDVNSMYPAQLASQAIPIGKPIRHHGSAARRAYLSGRDGVFRAIVSVPVSDWIPPLPYRCDTDRIAYPVGVWDGWYVGAELRHAEEYGTRILDVSEAIAWKRSAVVFGPWVDKIFALRMATPKGTPVNTWLKFYANSLTGKLGANPYMDSVVIEPENLRVCNCDDKAGNCACGADRPLCPDRNIYSRPSVRFDDCMHPEWSSHLTATARCELHRQLVAGGENDAIYCDTDSVLAIGERTERIGKALGQWDDNGAFTNFRALAPKVYTYRKADGDAKIRAKGIRMKTAEQFEDASRGSAMLASDGIVGFRTGARRGKFFTADTTYRTLRKHGPWIGDRRLATIGEQITNPPRVDDCIAGFPE